MTTYVGKFITAVSSALEFNTATLSGAIDIVVIEDDDGRRKSTPFHVRFGKLQLLKSRGIPIHIDLNGNRTQLRMFLGAAGEAYFYNPPHHTNDPEQMSSQHVQHSHFTQHTDAALSVQYTANMKEQNEQREQTVLSQPVESHSRPTTQSTESFLATQDPSASPTAANTATIDFDQLETFSVDVPVRSTSTPVPDPFVSSSSPNLHSPSVQKHHAAPFLSSVQSTSTFPTPCTPSASTDLRSSYHSSSKTPHPTSPIPTNDESNFPFTYMSDSEVELTRTQRDGETEVVDEPRSPPVLPSHLKRTPTSVSTTEFSDLPPSAIPSHSTPTVIDQSDGFGSALFGLPTTQVKTRGDEAVPNTKNVDSEQHVVEHYRTPSPDSSSVENVDRTNVTVSATIHDIVGEEDRKLDCRSVDGYEADDDGDALSGLQQHVSRVLTESRSLSLPSLPTPQPKDITELEISAAQVGGTASDDHNAAVDGGGGTRGAGNFPQASALANSEMTDRGDLLTLSLCGDLVTPSMEEEQILELFERHRVPFSDFEVNPSMLFDSALLFRVDNRLVEFRVAAPLLFAALAYNERMDVDTLAELTAQKKKVEAPKSPPTPRRFRWFWSSPSVEGEPLLKEDDISAPDMKKDAEIDEKRSGEEPENNRPADVGDENMSREISTVETGGERVDNEEEKNVLLEARETTEGLHEDIRSSVDRAEEGGDVGKWAAAEEGYTNEVQETSAVPFTDLDPEYLSLLPTAEQLRALDLKPGANSVRFFVEASSVELNCRIFLWSCHNKIVISDVDGTITRSDVLGHLLPAVGRDWSQVGVAGLYSQIEKNGYKLLYLTARPIGQASQTRAFLHSVVQGGAKLPNGPVVMSPNRLVESFTREVIRRKPHEFKIGALREVRSLFSPDYNPFHAGFGNRDTDVISYRAVGLIPQRIFVVNPKGELVVMKARYESAASYSTLQDLVESVFPDISGFSVHEKIRAMTVSTTFNDWNFWRGTLPSLDLDELITKGS